MCWLKTKREYGSLFEEGSIPLAIILSEVLKGTALFRHRLYHCGQ